MFSAANKELSEPKDKSQEEKFKNMYFFLEPFFFFLQHFYGILSVMTYSFVQIRARVIKKCVNKLLEYLCDI